MQAAQARQEVHVQFIILVDMGHGAAGQVGRDSGRQALLGRDLGDDGSDGGVMPPSDPPACRPTWRKWSGYRAAPRAAFHL